MRIWRFPLLSFIILLSFHCRGAYGEEAKPAHKPIVINEFQAAHKYDQWVELYNPNDEAIDISKYTITDKRGYETVGTIEYLGRDFGVTTIPARGYVVLPVFHYIKVSGGRIQLFTDFPDFGAKKNLSDDVYYGTWGGAPMHPKGCTSGRVPDETDTGDYARDWTILREPTPGAPNKGVAPANLGTSVRINEVDTSNNIVELYNPGDTAVDLEGWSLCDTDAWFTITKTSEHTTITITETVIPPKGFMVFQLPMDLGDYDVLYLFDNGHARIDQFGYYDNKKRFRYSNFSSLQRVPDGFGPYDGYDFETSGGGTLIKQKPPTLGKSNKWELPAEEKTTTSSTTSH